MFTVSPRPSLDALTKARLLELCGRFEVEIAAARPKVQVIDALAKKSRIVSFEQPSSRVRAGDGWRRWLQAHSDAGTNVE
jgi:phage antirepressor YoqD-like protein